MFFYVSIDELIPASHPLRRIRKLVDQVLDRLNPTCCELYAAEGWPSLPSEEPLLDAFCGIRLERFLLEQLYDNLFFRRFVGLSPGDVIWHSNPFTMNREPLLIDDIMERFP